VGEGRRQRVFDRMWSVAPHCLAAYSGVHGTARRAGYLSPGGSDELVRWRSYHLSSTAEWIPLSNTRVLR